MQSQIESPPVCLPQISSDSGLLVGSDHVSAEGTQFVGSPSRLCISETECSQGREQASLITCRSTLCSTLRLPFVVCVVVAAATPRKDVLCNGIEGLSCFRPSADPSDDNLMRSERGQLLFMSWARPPTGANELARDINCAESALPKRLSAQVT